MAPASGLTVVASTIRTFKAKTGFLNVKLKHDPNVLLYEKTHLRNYACCTYYRWLRERSEDARSGK